MDHRTCAGCGERLIPGGRERNRRLWCSEQCRIWAYRHPGEPNPAKVPRWCVGCGSTFTGRSANATYCSDSCPGKPRQIRPAKARATGECLSCGSDISHRRADAVTCGKRCRERLAAKRAGGRTPAAVRGDHARRARLAGAHAEQVDPLIVFERDRWVCGICGDPVDPSLRWPDPASRSLDHIVPLAQGGPHTMANTQLAHLRCNLSKGSRIVGHAQAG